jgi:hypothetical protein
LVLSLPLVHCGIILSEERYLERKFGDEYRRYQNKVPGYGGDSEVPAEFLPSRTCHFHSCFAPCATRA